MANRRPPLSFPELEGRGRRAILRTTEDIRAEEDMLQSQQPRMPATQQAGIPDSSPPGPSSPEAASKHSRSIKATYRLSPDAIDAIEEAKRLLRRRYNIRASLEEIAEEALLMAYRDLLENQQTSTLVSQLSSKQESRQARKPERE